MKYLLGLLLLTIGCSRNETSSVSPSPQENQDAVPATIRPTAADVEDTRETPASVRDEPVFRQPDDRPDINQRRLEAAGIHGLESMRLVLLTDRPPETVQHLPPLADAFYEFLSAECGSLHPAVDGSEFQVTGCLIDDDRRFVSSGLMPEETIGFNHGRQRGYRFWMRHQADAYYERHLLLHEFAHGFTHSDQQQNQVPPEWFLEGSAEVFATHRIREGQPEFGVIPESWEGFEGWGRIAEMARHSRPELSDDLSLSNIPLLAEVRDPASSLRQSDGRYAFWWAFCTLLRNHPDYADDWKQLCGARRADDFAAIDQRLQSRAGRKLKSDWLLFVESVCEGFDVRRSFPQHVESRPATGTSGEITFELQASFGWQDTGRDFAAGDVCQLRCDGECMLANTTVPWISEASGITLDWNRSRPVGEVQAVLVDPESGISRRMAVGLKRRIRMPRAGRLWLQVNDSEASRHDNAGAYLVTIRDE